MSVFSNETVRARPNRLPTKQPPSPSNLFPVVQPAAAPDRQRSSSFSENLALLSAQRVLGLGSSDGSGGGGLSANSSFRRRSSGGHGGPSSQSFMSGRASSSSLGLGRRDSQSTSGFLRSPPIGLASSSGGNVPTLKTLDSYNARNVAAALDQGMDQGRMIDDVWQSVCVRVLPLFNGEGIRGFVEDLNDLVMTHVQRTFSRVSTTSRSRYHHSTKNPSLDLSSLVTGLLIADLTDLVRIGCSTLSTKLSPPVVANPAVVSSGGLGAGGRVLSDQKLIDRLNEIWLFFYTGILPQLEAVFWVLRCDDRLRAAVGGTGMERNEERGRGRGEGRIDVRRIALIEFRDGILHPEMERIVGIFVRVYHEVPRFDGGGGEDGEKVSNEATKNSTTTSTNASPPVISTQDIRRSRSQPRPSTESSPSSSRPTTSSAFLSPPLPSSSNTPSTQHHPHPVPTTQPTNHLPSTPIRQFSSPARLPSPDPSPSNSPTSTRRNTLIQNPNLEPTVPTISIPQQQQPQQSRQSLQRRLQMILVLKGLKTFDDRQEEMERLSNLIVSRHDLHSSRGGGGGGRGGKFRRKMNSGRDRRDGRNGGNGKRQGERKSYSRGGGGRRYDGAGDEDDETASYDQPPGDARGERNRRDDEGDTDDEKGRDDDDEDDDADDDGGEEEEDRENEHVQGVDSPRILFDEPSDFSDETSSRPASGTNLVTRRRQVRQASYDGSGLPRSTTSSAAPSRSNSRTRRGGGDGGARRSITLDSARGGGLASGYASPILSTSPTEAALDLSGLGYALSRVREEGQPRRGGGTGDGSESSDGITPTASAPGSVIWNHGNGGGRGGGSMPQQQQQQQQQSQQKKRRSLFSLNRGNSSTSQDTLGAGLNVPGATEGDGGTIGAGSGGGGGEKLRRNLLRRNSSRTSATLPLQHELSTVLGGKGLSLEDD